MNEEQGFALHPLAAEDITEIWEYIVADNPIAARRVREEIYSAIRGLHRFQAPATGVRTSPRGRFGSFWYVSI